MIEASAPLLVALLTPRGRGAVAVIRVIGDHGQLDADDSPMFRAANGRRLAEQPLGQIVFGQWGRHEVEDVVLCRIDGEKLEICCHGGDAAVERILRDCSDTGANIVSWTELEAKTTGFLDAEIHECLSRAVTWRTAEILLQQADGRLRRAFEELAQLAWSDENRRAASARIDELLTWSDFGIHLSQPWKVVLTGRPNVGKSSLINALLGYQRSIVFDQPGTTRDVVTAETAFEGWPVLLSDTAGLRPNTESLEAEGIARARVQIEQADLVIEMIDISDRPEPQWHAAPPKTIFVAHKCDLPDAWGNDLPSFALKVSSLTGAGLSELQREIVRRLVPASPPEECAIPVTERQVMLLKTSRAALNGTDEAAYHCGIAQLLNNPEI